MQTDPLHKAQGLEPDPLSWIKGIGVIASALVAILSLTGKGRDKIKMIFKRRKESKRLIKSLPLFVKDVKEALQEISDRQIQFQKELTTNNGSSLKDEVRLLIAERMIELQETRCPVFRTTPTGENVFVNRAYESLVQSGERELLGLGWKQYCSDERELDSYDRRWEAAAKTDSHFSGSLSIKGAKGGYRGRWLARIVPLGEYKNHDQIWGGRLFPVDDVAKGIANENGWGIE